MIDWILFKNICFGALPVLILFVIILILLLKNNNMTRAKRIYRSVLDRKIAGVCGGLGEYFDIDPVIIRILWVVLVLVGGGGLIAYLIALIVIPNDPSVTITRN